MLTGMSRKCPQVTRMMTLWLKGVSLVQPVSGKHTAFQKATVQRVPLAEQLKSCVWKLHCQIQHREIFNIQMDLLLVTFPKHLSFGFWIQKFFSMLPSELLDAGSYPQIMNMIFNPLSVAYKIITPFCPKKGPSHFFVRHVDYWPQDSLSASGPKIPRPEPQISSDLHQPERQLPRCQAQGSVPWRSIGIGFL